jgi:AcrR family transcriptional regulator
MPPGRHTLSRDFVAQHQRERLLIATLTLVAKRGYQGTTVEHIVKTARVAWSTFNDNFSSKEDAFLAAFDRAADEMFSTIETAVAEEEGDWPEQARAGLSAFLKLVTENPALARACLVEAQTAGAASLSRYEAALERYVPMLREGRRYRSAPHPLPKRLEEAIVGGLVWIVHRRLTLGTVKTVEDLLPEMLEILLRPYLGESDARRIARQEPTEAA